MFRLVVAVAALAALTAAGTVGYVLIEGASWFDALYMTTITLSTIGYGEIFPLSEYGRMFTIGLIVGGVGTAAYLLTTMGQVLAADMVSRLLTGESMQKQIERVDQHIIVCGYGRLAQVVVSDLKRAGLAVVIVDRDPTKQHALEQSGCPYVIGNATSDEVLTSAGLERARAIVAGTKSDPDNVFIVLAARERRADIRIHARGETPEAIRRLTRAGADYVLSAYQLGGASFAASILRPSVAHFLEIARPRVGHEIDIEEVRVAAGARLVARTLSAIEQDNPRLRIVALKRGEQTELVPERSVTIEAGDFLVVIGERKTLELLAELAAT